MLVSWHGGLEAGRDGGEEDGDEVGRTVDRGQVGAAMGTQISIPTPSLGPRGLVPALEFMQVQGNFRSSAF